MTSKLIGTDKLKQDILYCQDVIGNLPTKILDQETYKKIIKIMFQDIFKDYLNWKTVELTEQQKRHIQKQCPEKLEPGKDNIGWSPEDRL